jgi:hypothetical protein
MPQSCLLLRSYRFDGVFLPKCRPRPREAAGRSFYFVGAHTFTTAAGHGGSRENGLRLPGAKMGERVSWIQ